MATTVLVVEDDPTVRGVSVRTLQNAGFTVITAADGVEALDQLGRHAVAVVLMDLVMPRMGGVELARRMAVEWPRVQLLFMTAGMEGLEHLDLPGELLRKPFALRDLVAKVGSLAARYWQPMARRPTA